MRKAAKMEAELSFFDDYILLIEFSELIYTAFHVRMHFGRMHIYIALVSCLEPAFIYFK